MHKNIGGRIKTQNKKDSFSSTFNADRMKTTCSSNFSTLNNQNIIPCVFKLLEECFERIYNIQFAEIKQQY